MPTAAEVLADKTAGWQALHRAWLVRRRRPRRGDLLGYRRLAPGGLPVVPIRWVLLRDPCRRFDPQALLCTDLAQEPLQIVRWFVQRWQLEVTFREVRDHLGVETQRQWSDKAIARTTPCLLGLFSIVTLLATRLDGRARLKVPASAWYHKQRPTFADTLAAVRSAIWSEQGFIMSRQSVDATKRCRRGCGGKLGWRSLRLVQRAMTGVGAPAETTPWTRIAARGLAEQALFAGEAWFDPIEAGMRGRIRGFIEELVEQELEAALGRGRYERAGGTQRASARAPQAAADRLFRAGGDRGAAGAAARARTAARGSGAAPCCRATPGGRASSRR